MDALSAVVEQQQAQIQELQIMASAPAVSLADEFATVSKINEEELTKTLAQVNATLEDTKQRAAAEKASFQELVKKREAQLEKEQEKVKQLEGDLVTERSLIEKLWAQVDEYVKRTFTECSELWFNCFG